MVDPFLIFLIVLAVLIVGGCITSFCVRSQNYIGPLLIQLALLFVSVIGLIIGNVIISNGSQPLYSYKVINETSGISTALESTSNCLQYSCSGNCMSSTAFGTYCSTDYSSTNSQTQGSPICTGTCTLYEQKYAAIKKYELLSLDNNSSIKIIIASIHSDAKYDTSTEAEKAVFSNIIGNQGNLTETSDFTTTNTIKWTSYEEQASLVESGYILYYVFGIFGIVVIVCSILWWIWIWWSSKNKK